MYDDVLAGEACYLRIRGRLTEGGFHTFDSIPRSGKFISKCMLMDLHTICDEQTWKPALICVSITLRFS